jgi:protein-disulfide isomerase
VILTNLYTPSEKSQLANVGGSVIDNNEEVGELFKNAQPLSDDDHILGNKDAKIKIVTFSDMECPFCITFEGTMRQIVSDYNGDVAWVYRHFPLDFHEYAMPGAIASECVAEQKGEESFWSFMAKFSADAESGKVINVESIAASLGVNASQFSDCYDSGKYTEKITANFSDGVSSGLEGTPYSVVFSDGEPVDIINGAYPVTEAKGIIDQYLQ